MITINQIEELERLVTKVEYPNHTKWEGYTIVMIPEVHYQIMNRVLYYLKTGVPIEDIITNLQTKEKTNNDKPRI